MLVGSFYIRVPDDSKLLPKPISIAEIDWGSNRLLIITRIAGRLFFSTSVGSYADVMGPQNGLSLRSLARRVTL